MISFNYETDFTLDNEAVLAKWIKATIEEENCKEGEINYIFCDDEYLHKLNVEFLDHDTLTDIISFDYSVGNELHGDVYISVDRVRENAKEYVVSAKLEMNRVIIHGILHYCGYKDKTANDAEVMRSKEDFYLELLKNKY